MQPKQRGSAGSGEASQVMADLKSLLVERWGAVASEEPELLLVHPKGRNDPAQMAAQEAEAAARFRARIEKAVANAAPEAAQTTAVNSPEPVQAERTAPTLSTTLERPRARRAVRAQVIETPPEPSAEPAVELIEPALAEIEPVSPIESPEEAAIEPTEILAALAAEAIEAPQAEAAPPEPEPSEPVVAEVLPEPHITFQSLLREDAPPKVERLQPTPQSFSGRLEAKRELRLTDSIAAGLKEAHLEVEELIAANRAAYIHLFGDYDLPQRQARSANSAGAAATGHLVGALSELQRSVAELGELMEMMLPRI